MENRSLRETISHRRRTEKTVMAMPMMTVEAKDIPMNIAKKVTVMSISKDGILMTNTMSTAKETTIMIIARKSMAITAILMNTQAMAK